MNVRMVCKRLASAALLLIALLALMHSIASADAGEGQSAADVEPIVKRIQVSLSQQHLTAWEGDQKVFEFPVTSGAEGQETLAGEYEILDKETDAYSDAWLLKLPFWMGVYQYGDFENGFHALPMSEAGEELWRDAVGNYPASHGCIVLLPEDAETLFNWAEVGTKVEIQD